VLGWVRRWEKSHAALTHSPGDELGTSLGAFSPSDVGETRVELDLLSIPVTS
jgi:hypothetical protein